MKKKLAIIAVFAALAAAGWYGYGRFFGNNNEPAASPGSNYTPAENSAIATNTVSIENYVFAPGDITVKKDTTVTWTNKDVAGVTITEYDDKSGPSSEVVRQDQTYSYKFTQTGLFHYHNSLDPNMNGTVTVSE